MRERQCNMDMPNGFSSMNVNKMMESSRNWNLANDVELLKCLEKFSETILNNASLTLNSMDNLEDSLNETFLKVRTVANKFQAIADNQFIENRVQEEEDFVLGNDEKDIIGNQPSTESSKAQILDCIRDCQNALGKKFETRQLSGIDSEDEMANSSPVVLVPKNAYKERRLPHLIGGEQFKTDETLGLGRTGDSMEDESIESDEEIDETDQSSYYSSNVGKEIIKQDELPKQYEKPVTNQNAEWNSSPKEEYIPEPPPLRSSYLSYDPPRLDNEPPPLLTDTFTPPLLPDAPILYETPDSLFGDDPEPASFEPPPTEGFEEEDDDDLFQFNKPPSLPSSNKASKEPTPTPKDEPTPKQTSTPKENPTPKDTPINSTVSREQLLSGRNFASFKEDLARVLSGGGAKFPRKVSSFESDSSNSDVSSPAPGSGSKEAGGTEDLSQPPSTSSHSSPASKPAPMGSARMVSPGIASHESTATDALPNVSTNVLENLAKGRAKVKGKRRPPSRKHRQANLDDDSPSTEQNTNPSNSIHSEEASVHESSSTQPGSNILSPATDEEDLFVLPAFDLPSDPPNRGLFFGNSLLSPGTTIDDGGLTNSPLFPSDPPPVNPLYTNSSPPRYSSYGSNSFYSISPEQQPPPIPSSEAKNENKQSYIPPDDLFSSVSDKSNSNKKPIEVSNKSKTFLDDDIFSETNKDERGNLDLFASSTAAKQLSTSPNLFRDLDESPNSSKTSSKAASKSSLRSSLKWDLLSSDDLDEDLFRSQKKESPVVSHSQEPKLPKPVEEKKNEKTNIFSPTPSFERSGNLFGDESNYSSTDIFSDSSSFMGLSLPKSSKDSLFASDDEDDDSLFKSSKNSSSTLKTTSSATSTKPPGSSQGSSSSFSKSTTSMEPMSDPLSSMDQD